MTPIPPHFFKGARPPKKSTTDEPMFICSQMLAIAGQAAEKMRWYSSLPDGHALKRAEELASFSNVETFYRNVAKDKESISTNQNVGTELAVHDPYINKTSIVQGQSFAPDLDPEQGKRVSLDVADRLHRSFGLNTDIVPTIFQHTAVEKLQSARNWPLPKLSLWTPSGKGRTLPILLAMAAVGAKSRGPNIVITTTAGCDEWMEDHARLFGQARMPAICIDKIPATDEPDLMKYKLVVVSFKLAKTELDKICKWCDAMDKHTTGPMRQSLLRKKPNPRIFKTEFADWRTLGEIGCEYLVFDAGLGLHDWKTIDMMLLDLENKRACVFMSSIPDKEGGATAQELAKRFTDMDLEKSIKDAGFFVEAATGRSPQVVGIGVYSWNGEGVPPWAQQ